MDNALLWLMADSRSLIAVVFDNDILSKKLLDIGLKVAKIAGQMFDN
jgi:hypothetical protein